MIPHNILKELIIGGVKFHYESYDHKKALEELQQLYKSQQSTIQYMSYMGIPDAIKQNHIVWRTGRLWGVFFNKKNEMWRFKIGCRYAKNFYTEDFGVRVKPILFKSDDKYDLIGQGLAIEDKM